MTTSTESRIKKKELLNKYPDTVTFRELTFNKKQDFLDFFTENKDLLANMFSIVSEIQGVSSIGDYVGTLKDASNIELKIFLMYKGNKLIGVIDGFRDYFIENRFYMSHFAIKKEHQLNGHGRALMVRAWAILNKCSYSEIEMIGISGTNHINLQLTGREKFKNEKYRQFKGNTEYKLSDSSNFIRIKQISKTHLK